MLFLVRGVPEHVRSDNGPEFTSKAVRGWLSNLGVKALFIEPGSPWENGYVESFNGKLRDESLNGEVFSTLAEAQILIERWRREYNQVRPHSALGYRPPAPKTILPAYGSSVRFQLVQSLGAGQSQPGGADRPRGPPPQRDVQLHRPGSPGATGVQPFGKLRAGSALAPRPAARHKYWQ